MPLLEQTLTPVLPLLQSTPLPQQRHLPDVHCHRKHSPKKQMLTSFLAVCRRRDGISNRTSAKDLISLTRAPTQARVLVTLHICRLPPPSRKTLNLLLVRLHPRDHGLPLLAEIGLGHLHHRRSRVLATNPQTSMAAPGQALQAQGMGGARDDRCRQHRCLLDQRPHLATQR